jgi:hypothetical protein
MVQLILIHKKECVPHPIVMGIQINYFSNKEEGLNMGNSKKFLQGNPYSSPFTAPWYRPKKAHSQVNGETQQTQDLIILEKQTRKRS